MNVPLPLNAVHCRRERRQGAETLRSHEELNRFFAGVERRALRIAEIGVRNRDDALDLVQEAMIKLAQSYADREPSEWTPLFYRILQNGVRDHHRRQSVRNRVLGWFGRAPTDEEPDPLQAAPDPAGRTPEESLQASSAMEELERGLAALPARQREAFMLRALEGLDVRTTAKAMKVSEGSVKTHYSRAVHALRDTLGDHWQ